MMNSLKILLMRLQESLFFPYALTKRLVKKYFDLGHIGPAHERLCHAQNKSKYLTDAMNLNSTGK